MSVVSRLRLQLGRWRYSTGRTQPSLPTVPVRQGTHRKSVSEDAALVQGQRAQQTTADHERHLVAEQSSASRTGAGNILQ